MANLKPVKLHDIIEAKTVWTDELWDRALTYLLDYTSTLDALVMAEVIASGPMSNYPYRIDFLREFRNYPPTVLLGAFDLMRVRKLILDHEIPLRAVS